MLVKACRQDTKIIKRRFWRLWTATIAITSYPASDNSHNWSWMTRIWNNLSPNNIIGRRLTTQNRVKPPQKPKKDKGHHKDEGNRQQRITGKAILPESSKACTTRVFIYWLKQVQQQSRSGIKLKTVQGQTLKLPGQTLTQLALGSARSQTPSKMWHTKCVHRIWYPLKALVIMHGDAYVACCHQRTPETMEMILAILGCVTQGSIILAL